MRGLLQPEFEVREDQCLGVDVLGKWFAGLQIAPRRLVSIKVLGEEVSPPVEEAHRFHRGIELLSHWEDPNVINVVGSGVWLGRLFYAAESFQGETLAALLAKGSRLTSEEIVRVGEGIAGALYAYSKRGLSHGSLHPASVVLLSDGRIKVADGAICRTLTPEAAQSLAQRNASYAAPERLLRQDGDIRSDLYSLGSILYHLAAGKPPFEGMDSTVSLLYQVVHVLPPSPKFFGSTIPRELEELIMECIAKDPQDRPQDPSEVLKSLEAVRSRLSAPGDRKASAEDDSGDFEIHIDQVIGRGGMGTLYRGRQRSLDRPVAVKVMRDSHPSDDEVLLRFRREAELLAQVSHPNVVQVYGTGTWNGRFFFAMELVEGEDLAARQARQPRFSLEEILHVAEGVARALEAAWKFKIVHRDIKPANILLTREGAVKVADFGLAKSLRLPHAESRTLAGTAQYVSPEHGMGLPVDIRTDLYSLGVVLYELAASRPPFGRDISSMTLVYRHVHHCPPPLQEVNPHVFEPLARLIHRCLAKEVKARPSSPTELLEEIASLRESASSLEKIRPSDGPAAPAVAAPTLAQLEEAARGQASRGEWEKVEDTCRAIFALKCAQAREELNAALKECRTRAASPGF